MQIDLRYHPYQPDPSQVEALQARLRSQITIRDADIGLTQVSGTDESADLLRALEQQTFDSVFGHRVPHTPDFMLNEYGPWDEDSTFFGALDLATGDVIGALRIITGPRGKTVSDLESAGLIDLAHFESEYGFEASPSWDIGSVAISGAIRGTLRGQQVATLLYHALYAKAVDEQIVQWTSVIDTQVLRRYHRLGIPFARLGGLPDLNYLGSSATACHLWVEGIRLSMETQAVDEGQRIRATIETILNGRKTSPRSEVREIDLRVSTTDEAAVG